MRVKGTREYARIRPAAAAILTGSRRQSAMDRPPADAHAHTTNATPRIVSA
jgi:hypothetical protein